MQHVFPMIANRKKIHLRSGGAIFAGEALSPFKREAWLELTPCERMRRSMRMRRLAPDIKKMHDFKLFHQFGGL